MTTRPDTADILNVTLDALVLLQEMVSNPERLAAATGEYVGDDGMTGDVYLAAIAEAVARTEHEIGNI